jgi:hypothetical protein
MLVTHRCVVAADAARFDRWYLDDPLCLLQTRPCGDVFPDIRGAYEYTHVDPHWNPGLRRI